MIRATFIVVFAFVYATLQGQSYTVESVPNQKLSTGSYVSNPDDILSYPAERVIDQMLGALEDSSTVQVAVVVLNSIGEEDHVDFAQRLFEHWGIGHADNDNGLLVLFVLDQRTVRLHTGFGIEGILTDAVCKRIEMEYMVPHFKEGKYDDGMIAGVQRIAELLNNPELVSREKDTINQSQHPPAAAYVIFSFIWSGVLAVPFLFLYLSNGFRGQGKKIRSEIDIRLSKRQWLISYWLIPLIVLFTTVFIAGVGNGLLYLGLLVAFILLILFSRFERINKAAKVLANEKEFTSAHNLLKDNQTLFLVFAFLLPVPMAFFYLWYVQKKKFFRNHPRTCTSCGGVMNKLDEKADDQFLAEGEAFEEKLGSVDYDIWQCTKCKTISKIDFPSRFTKYDECPKCDTRAMYSKSRRTIVSATTSSTGKGEETRECKFCHHIVIRPYTIPKVSTSSSSSSGGGGGGSRSWGGGSSGGGGSSSSW